MAPEDYSLENNEKSWGRLILASKSPRRFDLLKSFGIPFETTSIAIKETFLNNKTPVENVRHLASKKAEAAMVKFQDDLVLGADTIVTLDQNIFGKPRNSDDATKTLNFLSDREHEVITAIALFHYKNNFKDVWHVITKVTMRKLSKKDIIEYVNTGETFGKAGAYAIQGKGGTLIKSYSGCYNNIVGLPTSILKKKLETIGF